MRENTDQNNSEYRHFLCSGGDGKSSSISKSNHDIIVRFTSFRHRKLFYRKGKTLKDKSVHLNLTKPRLKLLNDTKNSVSSKKDIAFSYADINCRCKVGFTDGK